ncbi:unnamed protein product [Linum tenue]|uniref:ADP-ribosyl cyclase/cyclic ADP-ribose hydrolase n=1 Tax=Linum tenue TaxID=586396 RepID=A0AAV0NN53_9ROSI|nr:unnamed protein product [Linum tenue]CAI0460087.1 unnamed protein product [Linum tenue]
MGGGDLPKGVNLRDAIRCAIEGSTFSVVILSREFASSQFRLDELVQIKEQHAAGTHACLPVFFHISPDDDCATLVVDSGSGSCFHDYFNLYKTQFTYRRVHAWIQAIAWLAGISGWVLTAGRSVI